MPYSWSQQNVAVQKIQISYLFVTAIDRISMKFNEMYSVILVYSKPFACNASVHHVGFLIQWECSIQIRNKQFDCYWQCIQHPDLVIIFTNVYAIHSFLVMIRSSFSEGEWSGGMSPHWTHIHLYLLGPVCATFVALSNLMQAYIINAPSTLAATWTEANAVRIPIRSHSWGMTTNGVG